MECLSAITGIRIAEKRIHAAVEEARP